MQTLWSELTRSRAFWVGFVGCGVDFVGCPSLHSDQKMLWESPFCDVTVMFRITDAHWLRLEVSSGSHKLELVSPGYVEPQLLGTMDCHQMSDLFRWDEFQDLVRNLSKTHNPTWALELLFSFYVAVTEDCAAEHAALLRRCLEESEIFSEREVDHIIAYTSRVAIRRDFQWIDTPTTGWSAEGGDADSMRSEGCGFDFARFNRFLAALANDAENEGGNR